MATIAATRKNVLSAILAEDAAATMRDILAGANIDPAEGMETLHKILAQTAKPTVKVESQASKANKARVAEVASRLSAGELFDGELVKSVCKFVDTAPAATAVLNKGREMGVWVSHKMGRRANGFPKGATAYQLAGEGLVWGDED